MKPTDEQVKKFWEWCGFEETYNSELCSEYVSRKSMQTKLIRRNIKYIIYPDTSEKYDYPKLTLDSLFKYAVPKLRNWFMKQNIMSPYIYVVVKTHDAKGVSVDCDCPALALFWAIWEVIDER